MIEEDPKNFVDADPETGEVEELPVYDAPQVACDGDEFNRYSFYHDAFVTKNNEMTLLGYYNYSYSWPYNLFLRIKIIEWVVNKIIDC